MAKRGLFVGMVTLDLIYLADAAPQSNQKLAAQATTIAAGGPATNAAVAFQYLGNSATIVGAIGSHPIRYLIDSDLASCGVDVIDLAPNRVEPPPIASIVVTRSTGDRAVISTNAARARPRVAKLSPVSRDCVSLDLDQIDVVLIDGHQLEVGVAIATSARQRQIPVVLDGGSWKPGLERVLPWIDYAICSANFSPPTNQTVFECLQDFGIRQIAITRGEAAIDVLNHAASTSPGSKTIAVPQVSVVDTLGAGDFFHGAFCHYILEHDFTTALSRSTEIAARSCESFGTRQWMNNEA